MCGTLHNFLLQSEKRVRPGFLLFWGFKQSYADRVQKGNASSQFKSREEGARRGDYDAGPRPVMAKKSDGDFSRHVAESSSLRTLRSELDVRLDEHSDGVCEF